MPRKKTSSDSTSFASLEAAPPSASSSPSSSKVTSIGSKPAIHAPVPSVAEPGTHAGFSVEERIRHRAYELYEQRGRHDGWADQDWLQAEAELRSSSGKRSA